MQFRKMLEEMSSILWGLSLVFNIILLLIGLPLCLLICCCCKKHRDVLEQDVQAIAKNHNIKLLRGAEPQKKRRKKVIVQEVSDDDDDDEDTQESPKELEDQNDLDTEDLINTTIRSNQKRNTKKINSGLPD